MHRKNRLWRLVAVLLLLSPVTASASGLRCHEALYVHCLTWTPDAAGNVFLAIAVESGLPIVSPIGTQHSGARAYDAGQQLFAQFVDAEPTRRAELCAWFLEQGLALLPWEPTP